MRKDFFDYMLEIMQREKNVYLIFVDLGYPRFEEFKKKFPDRVFTTGASEQTALDICVGLAYSGKTPFIYTITPFLYRGFETIRTYLNHEKLNIKLIGAGRDDDYSKDDGYSHDAKDIGEILGTQKNIIQYYPNTTEEMKEIVDNICKSGKPEFLSLRR